MSERAKVQRELAEGALGYVLVVVRSRDPGRKDRRARVGDPVSVRERGLTPRQSRMALTAVLDYLRTQEN